jgi:hypothetical protein
MATADLAEASRDVGVGDTPQEHRRRQRGRELMTSSTVNPEDKYHSRIKDLPEFYARTLVVGGPDAVAVSFAGRSISRSPTATASWSRSSPSTRTVGSA